MATTWNRLGTLRIAQGRPEGAVPWHVRALAVRLALGVPQAGIDLRALAELRSALGDSVFSDLVRSVTNPESVTNLLRLLNEQDGGGD